MGIGQMLSVLVAVLASWYEVTNSIKFIVQREEGVKKAQKIAVILVVYPSLGWPKCKVKYKTEK